MADGKAGARLKKCRIVKTGYGTEERLLGMGTNSVLSLHHSLGPLYMQKEEAVNFRSS